MGLTSGLDNTSIYTHVFVKIEFDISEFYCSLISSHHYLAQMADDTKLLVLELLLKK